MAARTQGAVSLGMSENVQGGHTFLSLETGKIVTQFKWMKIPTPQSVINRIHAMAKGQPSMPVFHDCLGNPIGDEFPDFFEKPDPAVNDDITGVDLDGNVLHKITGVDTADDINDNHTEAIEEPITLAVKFDLGQTPNEQPVGNGQTPDVQPVGDVVQSMPLSDANAGLVKTTTPEVRRSSWAKTAVKKSCAKHAGEELFLCYNATWS